MRRALAWLWAFGLAAAAAAAPWVEDPAVPEPDVSRFEPAIQEQLRSAAALLADLKATEDPQPEVLGPAYGRLGQLYFVYDLNRAAEAALENAARLAPSAFGWTYLLGVVERAQGNLEGSIRTLERALALRPHAPGWVRLGDSQRELGRLEEAAASYEAALALDPGLAAAWEGLGRIAYQEGDAAAAAQRLERALELQPEATVLHHQLGLAYRDLGDLETARRHLEANRGGRVELPDPALDGLAELVASTQVDFAVGIQAMRRGDAETAVQAFQAAMARDPDDPLVAYNLALAELARGERGEALRWLERCVELDPEFRNGHFNLAELLAEEGRLPEAEAHYRRAHEIDPDDAASHVGWAKSLAALGERDRALAELAVVLEREPGNGEALTVRGIVEAQLGREVSAEASFREGAAVGSAEAEVELGVLLERQGRRAEAEAAYRAAVDAEPQHAEAWERLAALLGRQGRFADAATAFERAVDGEPERADLRFGRAMALVLAGEEPAARTALEEAVAALPGDLSLRHLLARLLATASAAEVRDGSWALELAETVFREAPTVDHAETVAMALAELGRYGEAVALQEKAVAQLEAAWGPGQAAAARSRLEAYRRAEPVRSPWRSGA